MSARYLAVHLPNLCFELCSTPPTPTAVVTVVVVSDHDVVSTDRIAFCSNSANCYGVRVGQRVFEARELVAIESLVIRSIAPSAILHALDVVAGKLRGFGRTATTLRWSFTWPEVMPHHTVWVELDDAAESRITKAANLHDVVVAAVGSNHAIRCAVADSPLVARILAKWVGPIVVPRDTPIASVLRPLPVRALPLPNDRIDFLLRCGVLTIGDVTDLPRAEAARRLGPEGSTALALAHGWDPLASSFPG